MTRARNSQAAQKSPDPRREWEHSPRQRRRVMISSVESHRLAEERSIALHAAVAERLRADASLVAYEDIETDAVGRGVLVLP